MASTYPRYFVIDGRPVEVVAKDDGTEVRALDPATGAMVPDASYRDRVSVPQVEKRTYRELLDRLRQPILERYATAPLRWEPTGDDEVPYRLAVDGHTLTIRLGDFPDEASYLMHVDGQGVYSLEHWPAAWQTPGVASKSEPAGRLPTAVQPEPSREPAPEAAMTRNVCSNDGWVVDSRALSPDPSEHDGPVLPKLGCTNLMCALCYQRVRSVGGVMLRNVSGADPRQLYELLEASALLEPSAKYRLYACHCAYHLEGGERPLDDGEGVQVGTQWTCVGHPRVELPREFDGVDVTPDNLADVVARAFADDLPANLRESERRAGVWAARLATRLDGTPYQERVVAAAAWHLLHADVAIRSRAVQFFVNVPQFAKEMRADVLLGQHPELFVGVPNVLGVWGFEKTLEFLVWRIAGSQFPSNQPLRVLARAWALDAERASKTLFLALVQNDAAWFADNAAELAAANPERVAELLEAADGSGMLGSVAATIASAASRGR